MTEPEPDLNPSLPGMVENERRGSPRYYHYSSVIRFVVPPCQENRRAVLRDVSTTGLCLHTDGPLEPGTALVVELCGIGGATHPQAATVIHATSYERGGWLIGCQFTLPLSSYDRARSLQFCAEDYTCSEND